MYSKKLRTAAQLLIVVCLIGFASCKKVEQKHFRIKVDSISVPDIARCEPDSIGIQIFGYIGPNKCHVYDDYLVYRKSQNKDDIVGYYSIILEVYGEKINDGVCREAESLLDEIVYIFIKEEDKGEYTVYDYHQPDIELGKIVVI